MTWNVLNGESVSLMTYLKKPGKGDGWVLVFERVLSILWVVESWKYFAEFLDMKDRAEWRVGSWTACLQKVSFSSFLFALRKRGMGRQRRTRPDVMKRLDSAGLHGDPGVRLYRLWVNILASAQQRCDEITRRQPFSLSRTQGLLASRLLPAGRFCIGELPLR